jgi:hypothetical protein
MWNEYFQSMMMLMVMTGLLRASYDLSQSQFSAQPTLNLVEKEPLQKQWAEKAVKHYAETQEKKWRNWNEAMFEQVK